MGKPGRPPRPVTTEKKPTSTSVGIVKGEKTWAMKQVWLTGILAAIKAATEERSDIHIHATPMTRTQFNLYQSCVEDLFSGDLEKRKHVRVLYLGGNAMFIFYGDQTMRVTCSAYSAK